MEGYHNDEDDDYYVENSYDLERAHECSGKDWIW
jgi:hypothetical protein